MLRPIRISFLTASALGLVFTGGVGASAFAASDADMPQILAAAERGSVHEQIELADAYLSGRGVPQDLKLAAHWYEKAAGFGDPLAQNQIGYLYQVGIGVPQDSKRAVHWFQLASASGYTSAKVNLGVAYLWGKGVDRNPHLAEQLIREAADKGNGVAFSYLGDMYYFGVGVQEDKAAAEQWYDKGVKLHNSLAEFRLGSILATPNDHPRDLQHAIALFRESAAAGYVGSMHSLGVILVNHPELGTSQEALSLLNDAAEAGLWKSSVVLGVLSRDGKLVPKDDAQAYFHFTVAATQGGDPALLLLHNDFEVLKKKLDANHRAKIDKDAKDWAAAHNVRLEVIYKRGEKSQPYPAFALGVTPADTHAATLIPMSPNPWGQSMMPRAMKY